MSELLIALSDWVVVAGETVCGSCWLLECERLTVGYYDLRIAVAKNVSDLNWW